MVNTTWNGTFMPSLTTHLANLISVVTINLSVFRYRGFPFKRYTSYLLSTCLFMSFFHNFYQYDQINVSMFRWHKALISDLLPDSYKSQMLCIYISLDQYKTIEVQKAMEVSTSGF